MNDKIGSPKSDTILGLEKRKEIFLRRLAKKQKIVNWTVVILFVVSLGIIILVSVAPFFSVKYKLASSSFGTSSEEDIIKDYYRLPDIKDVYLPFTNFNEDEIESSNITRKIEEELALLQGSYGVYVKNLKNNENIEINQNKIFTAASLTKLFTAGTYYKTLRSKAGIKNEILVLREEDKIEGAGSLINDPVGSKYYPDELLEKMLKESDNTAFAIMTSFLGIKNISNFIEKLGLINTSFGNNDATPFDIGLFLEGLYKYEFLGEYYSKEMIELMTNTAFEDRIPFYLPEDTRVAHKIGTWSGAYSDAGIVFAPGGDYVIVVMTENANYTEAVNAIRKISQIVYEYFN